MSHEPQNWIEMLSNLPPALGGFLMAVIVSVLRVVYDQEETSAVRIILEALICGSLTLAGGSATVALGLGDGWHLFIGGAVGFLGSQSIKQLAIKVINKRVDKQ